MHPHQPRIGRLLLTSIVFLAVSASAYGQTPFGRLPSSRFDVVAPSDRVAGEPGTMTVRQTGCRTLPASEVRRRVVDVAVQEWGFFGFSVLDRMGEDDEGSDASLNDPEPGPRRRPRLPPAESARVAHSIAGYWTATPEATWILARQNREWTGPDGIGARWQYPWSAAFISWVMCEGGLGATRQFQRAVAHHTYIDQAIRARASRDVQAAFVAHDVGDAAVEPGDLLCSARRPAYRTIADRLRQMGNGARTHCDVVVKVDADAGHILAIGGNVRGLVSLKVMPGILEQGALRPRVVSLGRRGLSAFAHLKLRAPSIGPDAMDRSPTMRALGCTGGFQVPTPLGEVTFAAPGRSFCAE